MAIVGIGSIKLISDSRRLNEKQELLVDLVILLILYALSFWGIFPSIWEGIRGWGIVGRQSPFTAYSQ